MIDKTKLKVFIASHTRKEMPTDSVYYPVLVGAAFHTDEEKSEYDGYLFDDNGDNISSLNKSFCELTGMYYAWKNVSAEYIGIVHYRRYFAKHFVFRGCVNKVISGDEILKLLKKHRVIVPKKRKYYVETMYSHYAHTHYSVHLDKTREIIERLTPEYLDIFDRVLQQRKAYMFNMSIMSRKLFDEYCSWLFPILFKLQEELVMPELSPFHERYYGRVAEIIFNVWLQKQIEIGNISKNEIVELPVMYIGKVNWCRKIIAFLRAKIFHEKYNGSF